MARALNGWFGAFASLVLLLCVEPVRAQDEKRIVVMNFEGPSGAAVRGHVIAALRERPEVEMVPVKDAQDTARRLGASLNNMDDLRRVAAELGVSAFIEGNVEKRGPNFRALVRVRNADTAEVVHEEPWVRKKPLLKQIRANFWDIMGPHILATQAPERPEPEPEEATPPPMMAEDDEEDEAPTPRERDDREPKERTVLRPALVTYLGPKFMWRTLEYAEDTTITGYQNAKNSPGVSIAYGVAWFPAAYWRNEWYSDLGLDINFEYTVGLKSTLNGQELNTKAYEFDGSLVYRYPLDAFEPNAKVGYVRHVFEIEGAPNTPAVSYSGVRLELGTAVHIVEAFSLDVGLAYIAVFDAGGISSDYGADAGAFEATGGATVRFFKYLGVRLGVEFRRYFLDFGTPQNAAVVLPKSGNDDYFRMLLGFVFTLPGVKK